MYKNILVPIDISYQTSVWQEPALCVARQLARDSGARIHALTVVPSNLLGGYYPDLHTRDVVREARNKLASIVRTGAMRGAEVTVGVESGGICAEILRVARELSADLIVMASHGPETIDYLLGSNASHIALHAPCSVYVVRERRPDGSRGVMAETLEMSS
ncbi:MAG: universal stress protein [Hyphomicrobiaceae bacterium]